MRPTIGHEQNKNGFTASLIIFKIDHFEASLFFSVFFSGWSCFYCNIFSYFYHLRTGTFCIFLWSSICIAFLCKSHYCCITSPYSSSSSYSSCLVSLFVIFYQTASSSKIQFLGNSLLMDGDADAVELCFQN